MKKFIGIIFAVCFLFMPIFANAEEVEKIDLSNYETKNLKETLAQEKIEEQFKSYSEAKNKVNIYMFRGNGCGYCKAFLTFLNGITDEYGKYFNLVSFETWHNEDNYNLMMALSNFLGQEASGVPYIIIGDQVFPGYSSEYDEAIKTKIVALYGQEPDQRYDIIEAYNENLVVQKKAANAANNKIIYWNLGFVVFATVVIILVMNCNKKEILNAIEKINVQPTVQEEKKEFHYEKRKNYKPKKVTKKEVTE